MKKLPNLGCADVKLVFQRMFCAGCACRLSLCEYYDIYGRPIRCEYQVPPSPAFSLRHFLGLPGLDLLVEDDGGLLVESFDLFADHLRQDVQEGHPGLGGPWGQLGAQDLAQGIQQNGVHGLTRK